MRQPRARRFSACETPRKLVARVTLCVLLAGMPAASVRLAAQPAPGHEPAAAAEQREEAHEDSVANMIARVVNFAILAGVLVYFLRSPFATYLSDRSAQIRADLVNAAEMKQSAAAQLEEIDRRMKALPA